MVLDNETAHNELEYIEEMQRKQRWKGRDPLVSPLVHKSSTDPLPIRLLALVEDLPSIQGPKIVGPDNYARIAMHS
jgi:hypothetical protein